jgi:hypothetical protein
VPLILTNLAKDIGKPFPEKAATFADNAQVSSWALSGVGQVQAAGIMNGTGDNKFSPKSNYTREQSIVTILLLLDHTKN